MTMGRLYWTGHLLIFVSDGFPPDRYVGSHLFFSIPIKLYMLLL